MKKFLAPLGILILLLFSQTVYAQNEQKFDSTLPDNFVNILRGIVECPKEYDTPLKEKMFLKSAEGKSLKESYSAAKRDLLNKVHKISFKTHLSSYSTKFKGFLVTLDSRETVKEQEIRQFADWNKTIGFLYFGSLPIDIYNSAFLYSKELLIPCNEETALKLEGKDVTIEITFKLTDKIKKIFYKDNLLNGLLDGTSYLAIANNATITIVKDSDIAWSKKYK